MMNIEKHEFIKMLVDLMEEKRNDIAVTRLKKDEKLAFYEVATEFYRRVNFKFRCYGAL